MLYQLPNGKTIEISIDQYLKMSDEDLRGLNAKNFGEEILDPFESSVLRYGEHSDADDIWESDEEIIKDLTDITPEEKLAEDEFFEKEE